MIRRKVNDTLDGSSTQDASVVPPPPPPRGRAIGAAALFAVACLVFFIAAEIVARIAYHPPNLGRVIHFDPQLGWSLKPGSYLHTVDPQRRFDYVIRINSLGLRDHESTLAKPPGVTRILTLGDSFTFGTGVEPRWRFSDIMGRALGPDFEVLNAGVAGWGNDQQLIHYETFARQLKPDIVVLTVMMANDVVNNMLDHLFLATAPKPRFVLRGDSLHLLGSPVVSTARKSGFSPKTLLKKSRFALFVKRRMDGWRSTHGPGPRAVAAASGVEREWLPVSPSHWDVYAREYDASFEAAWRVTEAIIERLSLRCREDGAHLLVFAFPLKVEVDDGWRQKLFGRTGRDPAAYDFDKPYRRMAAFCEEWGIDFFYPLAAFREAHGRHAPHLDVDGHPSRFGNLVAARTLLEELSRRYGVAYDDAALEGFAPGDP